MYTLPTCMVCGEAERTIISEYNRLIFIDETWQSDVARFNYGLCHGCGLVYATRRPERAEYDYLYQHFNEFLLRKPNPKSLNVPELTEERRTEIDRSFLPWWEIRERRTDRSVYKRLSHELDNVVHYLPWMLLNLSLEGAKVLHIRAESATFGDFMKRVLGASQVDLITLFPAHTYLAEKYPGIRATACLDYENFEIPYDEKYDLIIENHIFAPMLDIAKTFNVFLSHLNPGGSLFLQGELSDEEHFRKRKNLFAELHPFHYQQFDKATLARILNRFGFDATTLQQRGENDPELYGVAKLIREPDECPRIGKQELRARLDMYQRWRDESILSLPSERCRILFGDELDQIWNRVKARGGLVRDKEDRPAALRMFPEIPAQLNDLEIATVLPTAAPQARG